MFAFSCAASFAAPAAIGCGFHAPLQGQLESMYSGSFPVAVVVRRVADKGVIDDAALDAPRNVTDLFLKSMPRLQEFRKIFAAFSNRQINGSKFD